MNFQNGNELNIQKIVQGNQYLGRVSQWVKPLQLELEGSWLKPH